MSLLNLVKAKDRILLNADELLDRALRELDRDIYLLIVETLHELRKDGDSYVFNSANERKILEVRKEIEARISKFKSPLEKYITSFNDLDDINLQIFNSVGVFNRRAAERLLGPVRVGMVKSISDAVSPTQIKNNVAPVVQRVLYKNVLLGTTFGEARTEFQILTGQGPQAGLASRYATQITRDAILQYDGTVQKKVSEEIALDAFMFVGGLQDNSRPSCIHMVNAPDPVEICVGKKCQMEKNRFADIVLSNGGFLKKDIPLIIQRNENDRGWIPGTNEETYFTNRNGYNCRHQIVPFKSIEPEKVAGLENFN